MINLPDPSSISLEQIPAAVAELARLQAVLLARAAGGHEQRSDRPLTVKALAERLNIPKSSAYALVESGAIRATRHGRAIRVDPAEVDAYLKRQRDRRVTLPRAA